jgi:hypothetical protein
MGSRTTFPAPYGGLYRRATTPVKTAFATERTSFPIGPSSSAGTDHEKSAEAVHTQPTSKARNIIMCAAALGAKSHSTRSNAIPDRKCGPRHFAAFLSTFCICKKSLGNGARKSSSLPLIGCVNTKCSACNITRSGCFVSRWFGFQP